MLLQGVMNNPTMMGELLSQLGGAGGGFGGVAADGGGATSPAACGPAGAGWLAPMLPRRLARLLAGLRTNLRSGAFTG